MAQIIFIIIINQIISLCLVRLIFYRKEEKNLNDIDSLSWHTASESMDKMEKRINELIERDIHQQEHIWKLQDTNRALQEKVAQLNKEIMISNYPNSNNENN